MKVKSIIAPSTVFSIESVPNKHNTMLVRFYENIESIIERSTVDDTEYECYLYDEYHLEMTDTGNVFEYVSACYDNLLAQAKALEENSTDKLPSRVSALENEKAGKDEVEAIWEQMASAYSKGVQEA